MVVSIAVTAKIIDLDSRSPHRRAAKKTIAYVRFSSDEQADQDCQTNNLRYAERQNLQIETTLLDGKSAYKGSISQW
jgi:hypothetical protein